MSGDLPEMPRLGRIRVQAALDGSLETRIAKFVRVTIGEREKHVQSREVGSELRERGLGQGGVSLH